MELMQDIAKKNGLKCLLHEKPFAGLNGSGKHNNWSVVTNTDINLFKYSSSNSSNIIFLAMLACIIKGVDEYADLLRYSISSAANDHRLGGNEAPPAIISIFLGDEIEQIIEAVIENKTLKEIKKNRFQPGVSVVPDFAKDNNDRNRTSPFAFTGNKFEFRGVGSSQSIAIVNTVLNAILAIEMEEMTREINSGKSVLEVIKQYFTEHRRIIFNGDGYSLEWEEEAKKRGLANITNTVDALKCLQLEKNINMLTHLGIFSEIEISSRYEIALENYCKHIQVEALTAVKMVKNQIYPACIKYLGDISKTAINLKNNNVANDYLIEDINDLSNLLREMKDKNNELETIITLMKSTKDIVEKANIIKNRILKIMSELRIIVDMVESKTDISYWPVPTYIDLLFSI
jgi:glutamine synthetase